MTNLGTLGNRIDLSHAYAAGSYQVSIRFTMYGLTFEAQRFVRTDVHGPCDHTWLYVVTPDLGTECVGLVAGKVDPAAYDPRARRLLGCPPARRARHLVAVAEAGGLPDSAERYSAMELA